MRTAHSTLEMHHAQYSSAHLTNAPCDLLLGVTAPFNEVYSGFVIYVALLQYRLQANSSPSPV